MPVVGLKQKKPRKKLIDFESSENMLQYGLVYSEQHEEYEAQQYLHDEVKDLAKQQSIKAFETGVEDDFDESTQLKADLDSLH